MANPKDACPDRNCLKTIAVDPSHFSGMPADMPQMLRCVLYEMYILAASAGSLRFTWPSDTIYLHPKLGQFTPSEGLKRSALVRFCLLHDFLYNPETRDDFGIDAFQQCGAIRPVEPAFVGFEKGKMFTRESINKWVAHLTWARINKPECVPQPKFSAGDEAIVQNSHLLLTDAKAFVESVTEVNSPQRVVLDQFGKGYWDMFNAAYGALRN